VVSIAVGIEIGDVVYFGLKGTFGEYYAFLAAVMVAWALPHLMEIWFRRADP
jgi:hypothetical protein